MSRLVPPIPVLVALVFAFLVPTNGPVRAGTTPDPLSTRAEAAMADRDAPPEQRITTLSAYADSLAEVDAALAARCLERAGIAAYRINHLDEAVNLWRRGVDLARAADEKEAEASLLNALAIGYTVTGDVEAALPVYERALALRTALADTMGLSRTWGNLAQAYTNLGRVGEALAAVGEADKWTALAGNETGRIGSLLRKATLLGNLQRHEEALVLARDAMDLAAAGEDPDARGLAAMACGNALQDLGRAVEALPLLDAAAADLRGAGNDHAAVFADQARVQARMRLGRFAEALDLLGPLKAEVAAAGHDPLLTVLRRFEGSSLLMLGRTDAATDTLRAALTAFEARRAGLDDEESRVGIFHASGELYAALARCELAAGEAESAWATVERGRAALLRDRLGLEPAGLDEIQARLAIDGSALVLCNDPAFDPLIAFVLTPDSLHVVELGDVTALQEDARTVLRLLAAGEPLSAAGPALERMSRAISIPILATLKAGTVRTAVVPPSFLMGFPLGVLRDGDGTAWGDRLGLTYLPNATALVSLVARDTPGGGIVALADPQLTLPPAGMLPVAPVRNAAGRPLPQARREASYAAGSAGRVLTGAAATPEALAEAMSAAPAVLHLATHAVVDPVEGGRSALLLAGDVATALVTAETLARNDFRGDLVVLSGCSTFGEHRLLGEGWFGLPRSFLAAGARSVVSTLWDVEDDGARIFMAAFYDALAAGLARDQALVRARIRSRAAGLPPRDWAAFVLTGVGSDGVAAVARRPWETVPWPFLTFAGLVLAAVLGWRLRR